MSIEVFTASSMADLKAQLETFYAAHPNMMSVQHSLTGTTTNIMCLLTYRE